MTALTAHRTREAATAPAAAAPTHIDGKLKQQCVFQRRFSKCLNI